MENSKKLLAHVLEIYQIKHRAVLYLVVIRTIAVVVGGRKSLNLAQKLLILLARVLINTHKIEATFEYLCNFVDINVKAVRSTALSRLLFCSDWYC